MFEMCEMRKVLKTQPPPISLLLKLCVVRECEEVFGNISTRDVDMSGHDELCMYMKPHHK